MAYTYPYYQPYYPAPQNGAVPDALSQFKAPYQQIPQMPPQMPSQPSNDMLWVLGEVEATSYPVAPNNTVTLWDKNQPTIYIKSVNAQGVPSMRVLDFTERAQNAPKMPAEHVCACGKEFARLEDFNALRKTVDGLVAKIGEIAGNGVNKTEKEGDINA